jgi:hypothetical protein
MYIILGLVTALYVFLGVCIVVGHQQQKRERAEALRRKQERERKYEFAHHGT